ncbi:MAG: hypothetical protein HY040_22870 [Planctomycetes bacterium]|nr:hypothetical protein [Planctomycetota bacterium]
MSISVACLVAFVWSGAAQAQVTLRYKFKEGEKLDYVMEQKMKMNQDVAGMKIQTDMNQHMEMSWTVQSVDSKGAAKIKFLFGRIKMALDTPMGKVEIDSNNKEAPDDLIGKMLHPAVSAIAGLEMSVAMDPNGHVGDVNIPEKALAKLKEASGPGMGDMLTPDSLKKMATQSLVFPNEAVAKGKSWTEKNSMMMPFGKLNADMQFTYHGEEERNGTTLQKISLKPTLKMEADPKAEIAVKMKSAEGKGTLYFDNTIGRIVEVALHQTMEMEVEAAGATVNQTIDMSTLLKLKKSAR